MRNILPFLFLLIPALLPAQKGIFVVDTLMEMSEGNYAEPGSTLTGWKFHPGDDPSYADSSLDDSSWEEYAPEFFNVRMKKESGYTGWFRLKFKIKHPFTEPICLKVRQTGASEIYLDGKKLGTFGKIHTTDPDKEERYQPQGIPLYLPVHDTSVHQLSVRYSNSLIAKDFIGGTMSPGWSGSIALLDAGILHKVIMTGMLSAFFTFYFTFFIVLSLIHFMLYWFYRKKKSNLFFAIFSLAFGGTFLWLAISMNVTDAGMVENITSFSFLLPPIYMPALLAMLHHIFEGKIRKWLLIIFGLFLIELITTAVPGMDIPYLGLALTIFFGLESVRIILWSIIKKRSGAWIIGVGILSTILFFFGVMLIGMIGGSVNFSYSGALGFVVGLMVIYATISIPLSMTLYLARDAARTSKHLEKKLVEVEVLSAKSLEQEKEKQKILEGQKEMLEVQVKERTAEISEQKKIIEEKNKDITDSINYAKRIQDSILPGTELVRRVFPNSFVLFKPKDIVSGDFYWFGSHNGWDIAVCADCTGHGVPGALMSMIGTNLLHQAILEKGITSPELILKDLQYNLLVTLKQIDGTICAPTKVQDGMDLAILCYDKQQAKVCFSGAQRPLWRIRNGELTEWKGDKIPISASGDPKAGFTLNSVDLSKGDLFIMSTDGYADQFGGSSLKPGGKKLMTKEFKNKLVELSKKDPMGMEVALDQEFESWKGNLEQMDDVCVIGIKI